MINYMDRYQLNSDEIWLFITFESNCVINSNSWLTNTYVR